MRSLAAAAATKLSAQLPLSAQPSTQLSLSLSDTSSPALSCARYLNGDVLSSEDMSRARLETASGCFLLADTSSASRQSADALTLLRAIAVHNARVRQPRSLRLGLSSAAPRLNPGRSRLVTRSHICARWCSCSIRV